MTKIVWELEAAIGLRLISLLVHRATSGKRNLSLLGDHKQIKGKIGDFVPALFAKGQLRPWTFEKARLVLELLWTAPVTSFVPFSVNVVKGKPNRPFAYPWQDRTPASCPPPPSPLPGRVISPTVRRRLPLVPPHRCLPPPAALSWEDASSLQCLPPSTTASWDLGGRELPRSPCPSQRLRHNLPKRGRLGQQPPAGGKQIAMHAFLIRGSRLDVHLFTVLNFFLSF
jgi:hypothetical protein